MNKQTLEPEAGGGEGAPLCFPATDGVFELDGVACRTSVGPGKKAASGRVKRCCVDMIIAWVYALMFRNCI